MNVMNGKFFRIMEILSNFFLLNLIWILMCLPIVTVFPATAAMFAVIRQWINQDDTTIFTAFFKYFKENLKQSLIIGFMWSFFMFILYMNFILIIELEIMKMIVLPFLIFILVVTIFTTFFIFPVMVQYNLRVFEIIKNSFILSMSFLPSSLLACLIFIGIFVLFLWQPITILISVSVGMYLLFTISNKIFEKSKQSVRAKN